MMSSPDLIGRLLRVDLAEKLSEQLFKSSNGSNTRETNADSSQSKTTTDARLSSSSHQGFEECELRRSYHSEEEDACLGERMQITSRQINRG